jgi:hypothetical protein
LEKGWLLAAACRDRGDGGVLELIHVGGTIASTIFCRQGGGFSTSREEALIRSSGGCSRPPIREVISSPRVEGGPLLLIVAGKELPSSRLRFLGGFAWRTPANVDGDAQGLGCKNFISSRVVFIKSEALFSDRRSPWTELEKANLNYVPVTASMKSTGSF